mmetsp:Transcript_12524/g.25155  ORF Transcript_12524/g.25155 Transcript_12524/m.25155 type:complete len:196 (+) Transcript_12524:1658-2245(+)
MLDLGPRAFSYYDVEKHEWRVEPGEFDVIIGASCEDIRASARLTITSATPGIASLAGMSPADAAPRYGTPRPAEISVLLDDAALELRGLSVPPTPPALPVTAVSTFEEIKTSSALGWCLVQAMTLGARATAKSGAASTLGDSEAIEAVCVGGLLGSSLKSLQQMTGGRMPDRILETTVHLLNGELIPALRRLCRR